MSDVITDLPPFISDRDNDGPDLELSDVREIVCKSCGDTFYVDKGRKGRPPVECNNCKSKGKDSAPKQETRPTGAGRPSNIQKLEKALSTQFAGIGSIITIFQPFDGMVIVHNSDANAAALVKIAERNPKVRKALENFVSSTAYGELAFVLFGTIAPILANHEILPPQVALVTSGSIPPEAVKHFKPTQKRPAPEASEPEVPFGM